MVNRIDDFFPVPSGVPSPSCSPKAHHVDHDDDDDNELDSLVGQLESDPSVKGAINELGKKERGRVRRLVAELGRAVAEQDYTKAANVLNTLHDKYGDQLEDAVEDSLQAHVSSEVFAEIHDADDLPVPTPGPVPSPGPVPTPTPGPI